MPLAGFNLAASPTLAARVMHTRIPASRRRDRVTIGGLVKMSKQKVDSEHETDEIARLKQVEENYDELRKAVSETVLKLCEVQNRQTEDAITAQVKKWEDLDS